MRILISVLAVLLVPAYAQVNTCVEKGRKVFRSGQCEGRLVAADNTRVASRASEVVTPQRERTIQDALYDLKNAQTLDAVMAAKAEIQYIQARDTGVAPPEKRALNCTPTGFGNMACR